MAGHTGGVCEDVHENMGENSETTGYVSEIIQVCMKVYTGGV
jgi:hypothetical protein